MKNIKKLTDNKLLNLYEICDPENHVQGYQFAERRGVDSIAFICYDPRKEKFLLNREFKPPISSFILGAFGGSIDKDKKPEEIVLDEVREEAGFVVSPEDIKLVGRVFVSTQMNQWCSLYIVFVDRDKQTNREPENAVEAMAQTHWVAWSEFALSKLRDWKPITIISLAHWKNIISIFVGVSRLTI